MASLATNLLRRARRLLSGSNAPQRIGAPGSPQGILEGVYTSSTGRPPQINTKGLLEGFDTMPWLRACTDKIGAALGMTDWRLYAVGAPPAPVPAKTPDRLLARPEGERYVVNPEELAAAVGEAVAREVAVRVRRARGQLEPWAVRDTPLQRQMAGNRWRSLEALRRAGRLHEVQEHPFYDALEAPNPFMGRMGLFKLTEASLDIVGDAFWLKQRNAAGVPCGYWPVPPHWVVETPTPMRPYFRVAWSAWVRNVPEGEMRWFHEPSPVHPYDRGSGLGWALGDELEIDEYLAKMTKQLFFNDADPKWIMSLGEGTTEAEGRRLERDMLQRTQGFWRKFKPYFLVNGPEDLNKRIHEFQRPTMEQLVYPGLRKAQRDVVLQTFGAPPELFGITENSNRATVEAAEYLFAKWVLVPRGERVRSTLQAEVVAEYDERLVVDYPSPVAEDKDFELKARQAAPWAYDADEWRRVAGEQPLPDGRGKVYLVPSNSYTTPDLADQSARPATPAPAPPPKDESGKALAEAVAATVAAAERVGARTQAAWERACEVAATVVRALPPTVAPPPSPAPIVYAPVAVTTPDQSEALRAVACALEASVERLGASVAAGLVAAAERTPVPPQPPAPAAPVDITPALERVGEELGRGLASAGEAIGTAVELASEAVRAAAQAPKDVRLLQVPPLSAAVTDLPELETETSVERSEAGIAATRARTRTKRKAGREER